MAEAVLSPSVKSNKIDMNDMITNLLKLDILGKTKKKMNENVYLDLLYNLYEIIDLTKIGTIETLDGIESFILNFDTLLAYLKSNLDNNEELKNLTESKQKHLFELINGTYSNEEICKELEGILFEVDNIVQSTLGNKENKKTSVTLVNENSDIDFSKIDELYKKLYEAIERNDVKNITLYRGRLIRILKKYDKKIEDCYQDVVALENINLLLSKGDSLIKVQEVLEKPEGNGYKDYLMQFINDKKMFAEKFYELYEKKKVKKIVLYNNALRVELKQHGQMLNERYSNEFLDKKAKWYSIGTMLPNAVGLAVKKLSNTISELKEAKTNRRRLAKLGEVAKDTAKVVGTPFLYLGKFVTDNWYALYALYKGFLTTERVNNKTEENNHNTELIPDLEEEKVSQSVQSDELQQVLDDTNKLSESIKDLQSELDKIEVPDVKVDIPDVKVEIPDVKVDVPDVNVNIPNVKVEIPEIPTIPDVDIPDVDIPDVDIPDLDVDIRVPEIDVKVDIPKIDIDANSDVNLNTNTNTNTQPEPQPQPQPNTNNVTSDSTLTDNMGATDVDREWMHWRFVPIVGVDPVGWMGERGMGAVEHNMEATANNLAIIIDYLKDIGLIKDKSK